MSWRRFLMATLSESDIFTIETNLRQVTNRIRAAYDSNLVDRRSSTVRLVAVTKTKPASAVVAAYRLGQRHFGENYLQELITKANDPAVVSECAEIKWHFIGHLQSNKISKLIDSVSNLFCIETVDSEKCARKLNEAIKEKYGGKTGDDFILRIMVQVNTSGELQKSGLPPEEGIQLATVIRNECPWLRLLGFMTIGSVEESGKGENSDFVRLVQTRAEFCRKNGIEDEKSIELSMGMSGDFDTAIRMGSTNVRVGSTIFGARATHDQK